MLRSFSTLSMTRKEMNAEAFELLLRNLDFLDAFQLYLEGVERVEELDFHIEVKKYRQLVFAKRIQQAAMQSRLIYLKYLSEGAPHAISVPSKMLKRYRKEFDSSEMTLTENYFDHPDNEVITRMSRGSYRDFKKTRAFRSLGLDI